MFNFAGLQQKYLTSILLCIIALAGILHVSGQEQNELSNRLNRLKQSQRDTSRTDALIELGLYYVQKNGELKEDLDSAIFYKNSATALNKKTNYVRTIGKCLMLDAMILSETNKKDAAKDKYQEAANFFDAHALIEEEAWTYLKLAYLYGNEGLNISKKLSCLEKAQALFHETGAKISEASVLQEAGDVSQLQGNNDKSLQYLNGALEAYNAAGSKDLQGLYSVFSQTYRQKGDLTAALKYGLLAEKTAEDNGDHGWQLCTICNRIGLAYKDLDNSTLALYYLTRSRDVAVGLGDKHSTSLLNMNLADVLLETGKIDSALVLLESNANYYKPPYLAWKIRFNCLFVAAYLKQGQPDKATYYFNALKFYFDSLGTNDPLTNTIYPFLITYLQTTKDFTESYKYLVEYRNRNEKEDNLWEMAQAAKLFAASDSATGDFPAAYTHYKLFKKYNDSLFNIQKEKQLSSLRLQYETERKDKSIQLLEDKAKLQSNMIASEKISKNLFISIAVLLLLLLVLGYRGYNLNQKNSRRLELKQQEINSQNAALQKLLGEKEWLLKEINHRVKNNLQIVISLLNTQSAYLDNQDALTAIQNSQHRMQAMSLIHQRLYQTDNLSKIDMHWYINEIVKYISQSFNIEKNIHFNLQTDEVMLDVGQAIPLGLLLNEAITNSVKYAFPKSRKGVIDLSFQLKEPGMCVLNLADDGIGLPDNFDTLATGSLGINLMRGLSEQIGGELQIYSREERGVQITVEFPLKQNE